MLKSTEKGKVIRLTEKIRDERTATLNRRLKTTETKVENIPYQFWIRKNLTDELTFDFLLFILTGLVGKIYSS